MHCCMATTNRRIHDGVHLHCKVSQRILTELLRDSGLEDGMCRLWS